MKKYIVSAFLFFNSIAVFSQQIGPVKIEPEVGQSEHVQLVKAPKETLIDVTETCKSWSIEEEIEEDQLASFLLTCVNEELNLLGYLPVDSIKK